MDREHFQALWAMLSRAHPGSDRLAGEDTAAEYFRHLTDLDNAAVLAGASRLVDELNFPPTIAELRAAAGRERAAAARAIPLPAPVGTIPMPWYVRLQFARQKEQLPAGLPLIEGRAEVEAECARRGIEVDRWPEVPAWYGARS